MLLAAAGNCSEILAADGAVSQTVSMLVADTRDVEAYSVHQAINLSTATIALALAQATLAYKFEYASYERSEVLMKEDHPLCATNRLKTQQRAKQFLFSQPLNIFLSRRLYQQNTAQPLPTHLLDEQGKVKQLADIFSLFPNKIIILPRGVAYKPLLAEQIARLSEDNIYYREGGNLFQIPMMFDKGRGDFLLEYPAIVHEIFGYKASLRSYPLSATDTYSQGHLMCNDTPLTRALLAQVDKGLETLYLDGRLLAAHLRWLPEPDHQSFTALFKNVFN